jgi:O-antigen/teichoic acid export membrane protein
MQLFKKIENYFLDTDYIKDLSRLVSGTLIANLIPILISPVLARMYTPEAFGTFGLYISIVNIATILFTGRYEFAIVLSKSQNEATNLFYLAISLGLLCLIIGYLGIGIFFSMASGITMDSNLWIFAIPISAYLVAINRTLMYFSSNIRDYKAVAVNKIIRATSVATFKVLSYPVSKTFGLITGNLIGFLIAASSYMMIVKRKRQIQFHRINFPSLFSTAIAFKKFFQFDLLSGLLNAISLNIPIIILSIYYTKSVVGQYSMAFTIINLPMILIGSSIGQIFYERISKLDTQSQISQASKKVINQLLVMGSFMMIILAFGDQLFSFVLGDNWLQAGIFAQYMAPWVYMVFIASPLSNLYLKHSLQKRLLSFNIILLLSRTLVLLGSIYLLKDVYLVILLFSIAGFLIYYILFTKELKLSKLAYRNFGLKVLLPLLAGMLVLAIKAILISAMHG